MIRADLTANHELERAERELILAERQGRAALALWALRYGRMAVETIRELAEEVAWLNAPVEDDEP